MTSLPPHISSKLFEVSTAMWQSLQTARACASSSPCQLALTAAIFSGPALLPPPAQSHAAFVIFFPPHPSQECRTEITTARKTAASLSISGKLKESFWKPHLTLWHAWDGTFSVVHVGTSQSDHREGLLYLPLSSYLRWFVDGKRQAFFSFELVDIRK